MPAVTIPIVEEAIGICKPGGEPGLLLGGRFDQDWEQYIQVPAYGIALAWFFLGVAIVADIFMNAIETITSKKKRVYDKEKQRHRTIKVWNETVANLTLMALGSSAPEILLNVVEVGREGFFAGALGPGTIVGSAAFNLLVITAVCVVVIPPGEYRLIKDVAVYVVTASFSLFAYIWMIVVLMLISKNVVEWWEAIVTFLFFPVLIVISFAADKGWISGVPAMANRQRVVAAEMTKEEIADLVKEIRQEFGDVDDHTMGVLIEKRTAARPSKAVYRAERNKTTGGKSHMWSKSKSIKDADLGVAPIDKEEARRLSMPPPTQATLEFATSHYAVKESAKFVVADVRRYDNEKSKVTIQYRTKEGSATAGKDFIHVQGTIEFGPTETSKKVSVRILDDSEWEQAEDFHIELFEPTCEKDSTAIIGPNHMTTVTIIDDDDPGCLTFESEFIKHDADAADEMKVRVLRNHGCKGEISCAYKTENDSAVAPLDYEALDDRMVMKDGEVSCIIPVTVKPRGRYDSTERFRLILSDAVGCRFDAKADGDETQTTCTIELEASAKAKATVDKLAATLAGNWDKAKIGKDNWKEQFICAVYVGGDKEAQSNASCFDWVMHVVSVPWKLIFATIPPPDFGGGWWCFVMALTYIGIVTAMIGDLAMCFGCALNVPNQITAITFVALGTSLPDTFASMTAATQDPYADASITNITGSNSVNVFLGLGLPWAVASIYWTVKGPNDEWHKKTPASVKSWVGDPKKAVYVLMADDLGFSVGVFTACAICAIAALALRRKLFKGELGGPKIPKFVSGFYLVFLWLIYVAASWTYIEVTED